MMSSFVQPHIDRLHGYAPGEQPRDTSRVIKLNTNECPYPPSTRVAEAITRALDGRLRLYPDPLAMAFRQAVAKLYGVAPEMVLAGNGSDDLLTILTRSLAGPGDLVVYPTPSYILYRTLAELQGARPLAVSFRPDWTLDPSAFAVPGARLTFLANPNSPSGTALPPEEIAGLARTIDGPLVIDEAYGEFADTTAIGLVADHPNLIVTRTLSKGYALAGLRIGYLIAQPGLVQQFVKVKDSYNCDTLSLLGGAAALEDQDYLAAMRAKVLSTRERLTNALKALGYEVPRSQANFVWCVGGPPAREVYEALKARGILVRLMRYERQIEGLRISVGTDEQVDRLLTAMREVVGPLAATAGALP
jgi:histidinol-phosphate aminotransferase